MVELSLLHEHVSASRFERVAQVLNLESGCLVILAEFLELEPQPVFDNINTWSSFLNEALCFPGGPFGRAYLARDTNPLAPPVANETGSAIAISGCYLGEKRYQVLLSHTQILSQVGDRTLS